MFHCKKCSIPLYSKAYIPCVPFVSTAPNQYLYTVWNKKNIKQTIESNLLSFLRVLNFIVLLHSSSML